MPTELILAREREKGIPLQKDLIEKEVKAEVMRILASGAIPNINTNSNSSHAIASDRPSTTSTFQIDPATLNGFIQMGFQRAQVLEALVLLQEVCNKLFYILLL